ncbi:spore photoproduct lyase [Desulfosarcina sp. BuS5]|uniref:SPL family radical SAM protein n=1 Tax=Desulfosarcina sp. BuS5 TaxID=933262 RepID=UPI000687E3FF|nr:DNA photolyase [Desulfosarcina sp. BuS5]WDN90478.1 spore photoproduct lyase [Desulfosarcina sp. BuS5]
MPGAKKKTLRPGIARTLKISTLYIDRQVSDSPLVKSIRSRIKAPAVVVEDSSRVYDILSRSDDPVQKGKEILFLTRNKGAFIKDCPGTSYYTCCGYKILHIGTFCIMDCSYCVLQSYFHPPLLQFFVNHDELLASLDSLFKENGINRIGTGEFTDSLIWELCTDLSSILVPKFAGQSSSILELKTKTTVINNLKKLKHNRKTIISWSLNTERIIHTEERKTASLSARLSAATQCESWGYPLSFHFDPVILYEGCEKEYKNVLQKLFAAVSAENIVWISLGTFRFMPNLKAITAQRFRNSKIVYGEFIPGLDGKMRYFKPLRLEFYKKMVSWIKELGPDVLVYFCMEDDDVWEKAIGFLPSERGGLSRMLDESAVCHCGLNNFVP